MMAMVGRGIVNKNLRNAEVIESMGMLNNIQQRWLKSTNKVLVLQATASSRAGLISATSKLIRLSSQSLILAVGAYLVIGNEITSGLMIGGSILLGRALAPIDIVIGSWKGFISARGQYSRLNELLRQIPADTERMTLPTPEGNFQFESAVVAPPGAKTAVLKGISLTIAKGDVVGVIGPSGAGKSTFARALLGIWPTANGKIRLDGADVFTWNREELGPHIGYLPQDIELFEGTISENIARFGDVDPEKVVNAAKMADVHDLILHLPEGYDTIIGATGGNLSGGQRQRVGLARALYGEPRIVVLDELSGGQRQRVGLARALYGEPRIVVLDEPNSNLDEVGEAALGNAIQRLKQKQTTIIVITHRNNVLANVDKLLILNDGLVSVYGPKDQVIAHLQQQQAQAQAAQSAAIAN